MFGLLAGIGAAATLRPAGEAATAPRSGSLLLRDILAKTERRLIRQALEKEKWNRTRAARVLGISRRQLFDKIRQYGLLP
jgi:DNA-binding NtrC family response regulator